VSNDISIEIANYSALQDRALAELLAMLRQVPAGAAAEQTASAAAKIEKARGLKEVAEKSKAVRSIIEDVTSIAKLAAPVVLPAAAIIGRLFGIG
jgi:hypothetical protein